MATLHRIRIVETRQSFSSVVCHDIVVMLSLITHPLSSQYLARKCLTRGNSDQQRP